MNIFAKEPVAIIAAVTAGLVMAVQFGVPINSDQQAAIVNFISTAMVIAGVWAARQNVASPSTLREAGTSLHQVAKMSDPDVNAHLVAQGPDAAMAPK